LENGPLVGVDDNATTSDLQIAWSDFLSTAERTAVRRDNEEELVSRPLVISGAGRPGRRREPGRRAERRRRAESIPGGGGETVSVDKCGKIERFLTHSNV